MLTLKRVYDEYDKSNGFRVLVDRLWPRGLTKEKVKIDLWLRDIAPSTELRRWFSHDPEKWEEFKKRYFSELKNNKDAVAQIVDLLKKGKVTLVYGAKDEEHNDAVALKEFFETQK